MSEIIRILNDDILPRVNRAEVFSALEPRDNGDYFEMRCPDCEHRTAFIYKNATFARCNRRNECSWGISIFDHLSGKHAPAGNDWWKVTEKLAVMAGVVLPEYDRQDAEDELVLRDGRDREWDEAKGRITQPAVKEYLASRGMNEGDLGYDAEGQRLVIPIRDRFGTLVGTAGRDITGKAERKYLYSSGLPLKEIGFIGLDTALRYKDQGLIIVEGLLDRVHLNQHGVKNVVALGNASVTKERLELLNDLGVRKIILALDTDEAGKKGTRDAIDRAYEMLIPPEVVVQGHAFKDASEDLANGLMWGHHPAVPCHEWLANEMIVSNPHPEKLIDAVIRFDERVSNPLRIAHLALHFFPVIEEYLDPLAEPLLDLYEARRLANTQQKSNNIIQEAARNAKQLGSEGKHEEAKDAIFEGYRKSEALVRVAKLQPVRTLNERLDDHERHILKYRDREILGLRCDIDALTQALLGLRGLIFLGGGPNLGKTVLATQLATGVLKNEPDACVVYVNLDMDTDDLITRIRCHMGEFEWKKYICGHDIPIGSGRSKVQSIGNRLVILDNNNFTGEVQEVIEVGNQLKQSTGCTRLFIVIDYIQVWEVPEDQRRILRSDNDQDEWRVMVIKQIKNSLQKHDALLAISEVRKEDYNKELTLESLKGSSRLSYAGDVVLLLQRLLDDDLLEHFDLSGGGIAVYKDKRNIDNIDSKEKPKAAKKIREWFEREAMIPARLQVAKGRDGTLRPRIPITAHFKQATILEGFELDYGVVSRTTKEARANDGSDGQGMDEGAVQSMADERPDQWWHK